MNTEIREGNTANPITSLTNCMAATLVTSAPISTAMIGISVMPPGTQQNSAVSSETFGVIRRMMTPQTRFNSR